MSRCLNPVSSLIQAISQLYNGLHHRTSHAAAVAACFQAQCLPVQPARLPAAAVRAYSASGLLPDNIVLSKDLEARLQTQHARFAELTRMLSGDPSQQQDTSPLQGTSQHGAASPPRGPPSMPDLLLEYNRLRPVAEQYEQYAAAKKEFHDLEGLSRDSDKALASLAQQELASVRASMREHEEALLLTVLPEEQDAARDAILEVRAGTGGAEAALFAAELLELYARYARSKGWDFQVLEVSPSDLGGVRTASAAVSGSGVFGRLRHEAGVHRVQRVPATETMGRVHTSTASVVVLPDADQEELSMRDSDLRIDTYRASGAGGQHVNTTSSAVRITHLPTGLMATCADDRSQIRNKAQAMRVLCARLYEQQRASAQEAVASERRAQGAGSADRNERIRTYNFAQDRVTDHRCGVVHHNLEEIMAGGEEAAESLDQIHDVLAMMERLKALQEVAEAQAKA